MPDLAVKNKQKMMENNNTIKIEDNKIIFDFAKALENIDFKELSNEEMLDIVYDLKREPEYSDIIVDFDEEIIENKLSELGISSEDISNKIERYKQMADIFSNTYVDENEHKYNYNFRKLYNDKNENNESDDKSTNYSDLFLLSNGNKTFQYNGLIFETANSLKKEAEKKDNSVSKIIENSKLGTDVGAFGYLPENYWDNVIEIKPTLGATREQFLSSVYATQKAVDDKADLTVKKAPDLSSQEISEFDSYAQNFIKHGIGSHTTKMFPMLISLSPVLDNELGRKAIIGLALGDEKVNELTEQSKIQKVYANELDYHLKFFQEEGNEESKIDLLKLGEGNYEKGVMTFLEKQEINPFQTHGEKFEDRLVIDKSDEELEKQRQLNNGVITNEILDKSFLPTEDEDYSRTIRKSFYEAGRFIPEALVGTGDLISGNDKLNYELNQNSATVKRFHFNKKDDTFKDKLLGFFTDANGDFSLQNTFGNVLQTTVEMASTGGFGGVYAKGAQGATKLGAGLISNLGKKQIFNSAINTSAKLGLNKIKTAIPLQAITNNSFSKGLVGTAKYIGKQFDPSKMGSHLYTLNSIGTGYNEGIKNGYNVNESRSLGSLYGAVTHFSQELLGNPTQKFFFKNAKKNEKIIENALSGLGKEYLENLSKATTQQEVNFVKKNFFQKGLDRVKTFVKNAQENDSKLLDMGYESLQEGIEYAGNVFSNYSMNTYDKYLKGDRRKDLDDDFQFGTFLGNAMVGGLTSGTIHAAGNIKNLAVNSFRKGLNNKQIGTYDDFSETIVDAISNGKEKDLMQALYNLKQRGKLGSTTKTIDGVFVSKKSPFGTKNENDMVYDLAIGEINHIQSLFKKGVFKKGELENNLKAKEEEGLSKEVGKLYRAGINRNILNELNLAERVANEEAKKQGKVLARAILNKDGAIKLVREFPDTNLSNEDFSDVINDKKEDEEYKQSKNIVEYNPSKHLLLNDIKLPEITDIEATHLANLEAFLNKDKSLERIRIEKTKLLDKLNKRGLYTKNLRLSNTNPELQENKEITNIDAEIEKNRNDFLSLEEKKKEFEQYKKNIEEENNGLLARLDEIGETNNEEKEAIVKKINSNKSSLSNSQKEIDKEEKRLNFINKKLSRQREKVLSENSDIEKDVDKKTFLNKRIVKRESYKDKLLNTLSKVGLSTEKKEKNTEQEDFAETIEFKRKDFKYDKENDRLSLKIGNKYIVFEDASIDLLDNKINDFVFLKTLNTNKDITDREKLLGTIMLKSSISNYFDEEFVPNLLLFDYINNLVLKKIENENNDRLKAGLEPLTEQEFKTIYIKYNKGVSFLLENKLAIQDAVAEFNEFIAAYNTSEKELEEAINDFKRTADYDYIENFLDNNSLYNDRILNIVNEDISDIKSLFEEAIGEEYNEDIIENKNNKEVYDYFSSLGLEEDSFNELVDLYNNLQKAKEVKDRAISKKENYISHKDKALKILLKNINKDYFFDEGIALLSEDIENSYLGKYFDRFKNDEKLTEEEKNNLTGIMNNIISANFAFDIIFETPDINYDRETNIKNFLNREGFDIGSIEFGSFSKYIRAVVSNSESEYKEINFVYVFMQELENGGDKRLEMIEKATKDSLVKKLFLLNYTQEESNFELENLFEDYKKAQTNPDVILENLFTEEGKEQADFEKLKSHIFKFDDFIGFLDKTLIENKVEITPNTEQLLLLYDVFSVLLLKKGYEYKDGSFVFNSDLSLIADRFNKLEKYIPNIIESRAGTGKTTIIDLLSKLSLDSGLYNKVRYINNSKNNKTISYKDNSKVENLPYSKDFFDKKYDNREDVLNIIDEFTLQFFKEEDKNTIKNSNNILLFGDQTQGVNNSVINILMRDSIINKINVPLRLNSPILNDNLSNIYLSGKTYTYTENQGVEIVEIDSSLDGFSYENTVEEIKEKLLNLNKDASVLYIKDKDLDNILGNEADYVIVREENEGVGLFDKDIPEITYATLSRAKNKVIILRDKSKRYNKEVVSKKIEENSREYKAIGKDYFKNNYKKALGKSVTKSIETIKENAIKSENKEANKNFFINEEGKIVTGGIKEDKEVVENPLLAEESQTQADVEIGEEVDTESKIEEIGNNLSKIEEEEDKQEDELFTDNISLLIDNEYQQALSDIKDELSNSSLNINFDDFKEEDLEKLEKYFDAEKETYNKEQRLISLRDKIIEAKSNRENSIIEEEENADILNSGEDIINVFTNAYQIKNEDGDLLKDRIENEEDLISLDTLMKYKKGDKVDVTFSIEVDRSGNLIPYKYNDKDYYIISVYHNNLYIGKTIINSSSEKMKVFNRMKDENGKYVSKKDFTLSVNNLSVGKSIEVISDKSQRMPVEQYINKIKKLGYQVSPNIYITKKGNPVLFISTDKDLLDKLDDLIKKGSLSEIERHIKINNLLSISLTKDAVSNENEQLRRIFEKNIATILSNKDSEEALLHFSIGHILGDAKTYDKLIERLSELQKNKKSNKEIYLEIKMYISDNISKELYPLIKDLVNNSGEVNNIWNTNEDEDLEENDNFRKVLLQRQMIDAVNTIADDIYISIVNRIFGKIKEGVLNKNKKLSLTQILSQIKKNDTFISMRMLDLMKKSDKNFLIDSLIKRGFTNISLSAEKGNRFSNNILKNAGNFTPIYTLSNLDVYKNSLFSERESDIRPVLDFNLEEKIEEKKKECDIADIKKESNTNTTKKENNTNTTKENTNKKIKKQDDKL